MQLFKRFSFKMSIGFASLVLIVFSVIVMTSSLSHTKFIDKNIVPIQHDSKKSEKDIETNNLADIPGSRTTAQSSTVLVSPSKRFIAYLDFVPGAGLTDVAVGEDMPYRVRTTGVITIRDTKLGKEWQIQPEKIAEPLLEYIPENGAFTHFVYPFFSTWSEDEAEVWGTIELHGPADPSFPLEIVVFRIENTYSEEDNDNKEPSVQFFLIPATGRPFAVDPEMVSADKKVLIEETNPKEGVVLALYLYDLRTQKKEALVQYTKEQLDAEFGEGNYLQGATYYIPRWFPGWNKKSPEQQKQLIRPLEPMWIDPQTISYIDFITRNKITVTIK